MFFSGGRTHSTTGRKWLLCKFPPVFEYKFCGAFCGRTTRTRGLACRRIAPDLTVCAPYDPKEARQPRPSVRLTTAGKNRMLSSLSGPGGNTSFPSISFPMSTATFLTVATNQDLDIALGLLSPELSQGQSLTKT